MAYKVLQQTQNKDYSFTCDRCDSPIYEDEKLQIKNYPYKKYGMDCWEKVETRHYCWRCKDE